MYCPNCGTKFNENANFCSTCGISRPSDNSPTQKNINTQSSSKPSLIIGILAIIFIATPVIALPLAIISIILGRKDKKQTNKTSIGTILGIVSIILIIIEIMIITLFTIFFKNTKSINISSQENIVEEYFGDYYESVPTESFDIKGHSFIADDQSTLYLNHDFSYTWYQNDLNHKDNYYLGTYKYYTGEDAIYYIANHLKEYGITEEAQRSLFQNGTYQLKNYYLIIINCDKIIVNQTEQAPQLSTVYYYGLYNEQAKQFDLVNIENHSTATFTLKEQINKIDI